MPVRSIYNSQFIGDIVGTPGEVEVSDARTGAVTTRLAYQPPRIEVVGEMEGGLLLPLTGSHSGSPGQQCPANPGCG